MCNTGSSICTVADGSVGNPAEPTIQSNQQSVDAAALTQQQPFVDPTVPTIETVLEDLRLDDALMPTCEFVQLYQEWFSFLRNLFMCMHLC